MGSESPTTFLKNGDGAGNPRPACCVGICGGGFKSDDCVGADNDDAEGRFLESWITVSQPSSQADIHEFF